MKATEVLKSETVAKRSQNAKQTIDLDKLQNTTH